MQLEGWSWSETPAAGLNLVWGVAPSSSPSVFVLEPQDLPLRARSEAVSLDPETTERLRALGYIN